MPLMEQKFMMASIEVELETEKDEIDKIKNGASKNGR